MFETPRMRTGIQSAVLLVLLCSPNGARGQQGQAAGQLPNRLKIQIDERNLAQAIDGFGATLTPFEDFRTWQNDLPAQLSGASQIHYAPGLIDQLWETIFGQIGITRMRISLYGFEPEPGRFDWTLADAELPYIAAARRYDLRTIWSIFLANGGKDYDAWLRDPGQTCRIGAGRLADTAAYVSAAVEHLRSRGVDLDLLALNEPDYCWAGGPVFEQPDYAALASLIGTRLEGAGSRTKLALSESSRPDAVEGYSTRFLSRPGASRFVGAVTYHSYDGYDANQQLLRELAAGRSGAPTAVRKRLVAVAEHESVPLWMTEVCYCNNAGSAGSEFALSLLRLNHLHEELTAVGVNAFDTMNLFFGYRPRFFDNLIDISLDQSGNVTGWRTTALGKLLAHYSRYILPGSRRIAVDSLDSSVRVSAFVRPDGEAVIVMLNNGDATREVELSWNMTNRNPSVLHQLVSTETRQWDAGPALPVRRGTTVATLPPMSVLTLYSGHQSTPHSNH